MKQGKGAARGDFPPGTDLRNATAIMDETRNFVHRLMETRAKSHNDLVLIASALLTCGNTVITQMVGQDAAGVVFANIAEKIISGEIQG